MEYDSSSSEPESPEKMEPNKMVMLLSDDDVEDGWNTVFCFRTSDGSLVKVTEQVARKSPTLSHFIDNTDTGVLPEIFSDNTHGGYGIRIIDLPQIHSFILRPIFQWCRQHCEDPNTDKSLSRDELSTCPYLQESSWDRVWLSTMDEKRVFALMKAADFLDLKLLMDLTAVRVGDIIKARSLAVLRTQYGLEDDLSPEEKEELKRKYPIASEVQDD